MVYLPGQRLKPISLLWIQFPPWQLMACVELVSAAPQLFARRETGNDPSSSEKYNPALCLLFGRSLSGDLAAEIE